MKKATLTLLFSLFICVSLSAQVKVDDWYIYNSSDFNTVVDKISKTLGGRPEIKDKNGSKIAQWDLKADICSTKEFAYGKTKSNTAFIMMTYCFYDKEEKAENLFNTLYKKSCKEEGGEGKLRENSNEIGENVKEYIWEKEGYIKILSIKCYLDELTLSYVNRIVESEFSQK